MRTNVVCQSQRCAHHLWRTPPPTAPDGSPVLHARRMCQGQRCAHHLWRTLWPTAPDGLPLLHAHRMCQGAATCTPVVAHAANGTGGSDLALTAPNPSTRSDDPVHVLRGITLSGNFLVLPRKHGVGAVATMAAADRLRVGEARCNAWSRHGRPCHLAQRSQGPCSTRTVRAKATVRGSDAPTSCGARSQRHRRFGSGFACAKPINAFRRSCARPPWHRAQRKKIVPSEKARRRCRCHHGSADRLRVGEARCNAWSRHGRPCHLAQRSQGPCSTRTVRAKATAKAPSDVHAVCREPINAFRRSCARPRCPHHQTKVHRALLKKVKDAACMHVAHALGHTATSELPSPSHLRHRYNRRQPQPSCTHACMHPACLAERVQMMLQEPLDHLLNQPRLTDDGEVHPVHARPQCWTDAHATLST